VDTGLEIGDIIPAFDRTPLQSTSQLQTMDPNLRSGDPVVLQVEHKGKRANGNFSHLKRIEFRKKALAPLRSLQAFTSS
jgi:hypothetical protein